MSIRTATDNLSIITYVNQVAVVLSTQVRGFFPDPVCGLSSSSLGMTTAAR